MRSWGARRDVVVAAAGVAAAVLATAVFLVARAGADGNPCEDFREAGVERASLVTGSGPQVVVIGDSYAVGLGVEQRDSWPVRLPGTVRVEAFSGSGFSRDASRCGKASFAQRAPAALGSLPAGSEPALVVVEGGLNDFDQPAPAVRRGFAALDRLLEDHPVLVVGPASAPAREASVPELDALLGDLAERHGASYLSMAGLDLPYLPDQLHLTTEGHAIFGDVVAAQVQRMLDARTPPG